MMNTRLISISILPMVLASLLGCSSGEEEEPDPCGGAVVAVMTAGFSCLGNSGASNPPPPPPPTEPPPAPPSGPRTVVMSSFVEYEPNSTFDNANPLSFRNGAPDQSIGLEVTGSVSEDTDLSDLFIFTPPRTDTYAVYLCGETCTEQPLTDEVFIAVYDQSQTTITGTPIGAASEQIMSVDLTAGLAYYVEVNGYNTGTAEFEYKLVVID